MAPSDPPAPAVAAPNEPFGQLLVALQPRLLRFLRTLGAAADLEDIAQETMARAWRSRASFDPARGDAAAWLLRIGFRAFLDARKARQPAGCEPDQLATPSVGPVGEASIREETRALLDRLPERERDVLLRFHAEGQSVASIAATLRLPLGTVKSDLHRARARLWALREELR